MAHPSGLLAGRTFANRQRGIPHGRCGHRSSELAGSIDCANPRTTVCQASAGGRARLQRGVREIAARGPRRPSSWA